MASSNMMSKTMSRLGKTGPRWQRSGPGREGNACGVGCSAADAEASQRAHHGRDHRHGTVLPHRQPASRREPGRGLHPLGKARHQRRGPAGHVCRSAVYRPAAPGSAGRADPAGSWPALRAQRADRRPGNPQRLFRGRLHRPPSGPGLAPVSRPRRARHLHRDRAQAAGRSRVPRVNRSARRRGPAGRGSSPRVPRGSSR